MTHGGETGQPAPEGAATYTASQAVTTEAAPVAPADTLFGGVVAGGAETQTTTAAVVDLKVGQEVTVSPARPRNGRGRARQVIGVVPRGSIAARRTGSYFPSLK